MKRETLLIEFDKEKTGDQLKPAAQMLREGGTVIFPTETVYGLGANALDPLAVQKIFTAKGRPADNPLIVHVARMEDVEPLVKGISARAQRLIDAFWPGPLTLIMEKSAHLPTAVTAGLETVGVRMPNHPVALELIRQAGVPVAAPSANLSGKPSPTKGDHVVRDMTGRVDAIVCADPSEIGVESTVLDITGSVPVILRPGGVTLEQIREVEPGAVMDPALEKAADDSLKPKSPGMKYTHYAPDAEVLLFVGEANEVALLINRTRQQLERQGKSVGIMTCAEHLAYYPVPNVLSLGSKDNLAEIAANLFDGLRAFDHMGVDVILAEGYARQGMGVAIMNRLVKAAGNEVIEV